MVCINSFHLLFQAPVQNPELDKDELGLLLEERIDGSLSCEMKRGVNVQ